MSAGLALAALVAAAEASASVAPDVLEMARLLGIEDLLPGARGPAERDRAVRHVLQASLEVDTVIADIQDEQAEIGELLAALQADHDARLGVLNLAAGIFAAGAAVGTGMTLKDSTTTAGVWVTTVTSGIGAALTVYAALAPNRGMPPLRTRSNLLAPFFGRPLVSGSYSPLVWKYLEGREPNDQLTRKDRLLFDWRRLGRIGEGSSKIDALTRPIPAGREVDIDLLQDRSLMLADVRARVASMKQGLLALLQALGNPA
jgi:hypothetical protein